VKLYYKDGITVQALSPADEAHYKHLGFKLVEEPKPVEPPAEKPKAEKPPKNKPGKPVEPPAETPVE
jgi:hypothetical protein